MLKVEEGDDIIVEYVGLCSKMYSYTSRSMVGVVTAVQKGKDVPASVLKKNTTFDHYKRMANEPYESTVTFRSMMSNDHEVRVKNVQRKMLSCCNDKIFRVSATESRPLGHWRNTASSSGSQA